MTRRRRSAVTQVRRDLHLTERALGDAQAARRGPEALVRRVARRQIARALFRLFR